MNIVDFLIANYHWILAIILLTIITIIGFLADKKKNDKKKEDKTPKKKTAKNDMTIKQQPMQYQPEIQNQTETQQPMMPNNINNINSGPMNQNLNTNQMDNGLINQMNNNQNSGTIPQSITYGGELQNNNNLINNPQPVENIVPEQVQEPMYQPLEEQKPHFTPQPIPSFDTMKEEQNQNLQIMNNQMLLGNQNMMNQQTVMQAIPQPMMQPNTQQMQNPEPMGQMSIYNQNANTQENNNNGMANMIPNPRTIPQPVNPIPVPQPVIPQPVMTNQMHNPEPMGQMPTYNMNNQVLNQNGFVGNQNSQQPMMQPNPQPAPMAPINFVYGPQNNNQNM